jgi:trans-aconitate 2-methyltransferase
VAPAADYARMLAPFGEVDAWETEYLQRLDPGGEGHPVRRFTESTAMRPYLAPLAAVEAARLVAAYEAALAEAYPPEADGAVLFPFRRLFLVFMRAA